MPSGLRPCLRIVRPVPLRHPRSVRQYCLGEAAGVGRNQGLVNVWTFPNPALNTQLHRSLHFTSTLPAPSSLLDKDRGPPSQEDTQTDFSKLDVLNSAPAPTTAIDICLPDGFQLDNGLRITNGGGCLLINGEALEWRPWEGQQGRLINAKGQWECTNQAWGVLSLVWPKPGKHYNRLLEVIR